MSFGISVLIGIALLTAWVSLPALIVYRRNQGRLSLKASYFRAFFHSIRVFGWVVVALQILLFLPLWLTDVTGLAHWGYPWWSVFMLLGFVAVGYGLQRLGTFLLRDEDLKNMLGRGIG